MAIGEATGSSGEGSSAVTGEVATLKKELEASRKDLQKARNRIRSLENECNSYHIKWGDVRRELEQLRELCSGKLDDLERLQEIQARGLLR